MIYSHSDFERKPFLAVGDIAKLLHDGSLMLFLGAGVSAGFGLPSWDLLVARLLGKEGDKSYLEYLARQSDKEKTKLIDNVDDETDRYIENVHRALYDGVQGDLSERLSQPPLLLAVAALLTGTCRGRITSVITYNYDDLLSQYLQMLGYKVCIRTNFSDLSMWADVEINHVHGYLPQSRKDASRPGELILSEKSYRKRRASIDEGWSPYVEHCLYAKSGLFLGLSGDDGAILDVLKRTQMKIKRPNDYTGYWLMTAAAFERNAKSIVEVGMCPICLNEDEFPKFVFSVCQQAADA